MPRRPWPSVSDLLLAVVLCGFLFAIVPFAERATAQTGATGPVTLSEPDTVHSDGADLKWSRFDASGGAVFDKYEIHRSSNAGFTPSADTLLTTIRDPAVTAYRDTAAAPSKSFSYKIVANTAASNEQTVALPADGQAKKTLQPGPADGRATYLKAGGSAAPCANYGKADSLWVGADGATERPVLAFDVRDIPAKATVTDAKLSVKADKLPSASVTVGAHRVTKEWTEGSGSASCTGDGTSWTETQGGVGWAEQGGSFAPPATDSVTRAPTAPAGVDTFNLTSMVQQWADGAAPNLGIMLKASDETQAAGKALSYLSDDAPTASERPKLTVSYADGSKAKGPNLSLASPDPAVTASGTLSVTAAAGDDGRVQKVEFLVDGALKATDSVPSDGFLYRWNTASYANGSHTLALRATDEAGNVTTTGDSTYNVRNSAKPANVKLTAPAASYAQAVKDDQPAGFWRLDELSGTTAADTSGAGRNGTFSGGYTPNQTSQLTGESPANPAVKFQNATTDGRVTISSLSSLLGSQLSAEAWVDAPVGVSTKGAYNRVVSRNWGSSGGWMLALNRDSTNTNKAVFSINQGGTISTATTTVSTGKHYLAGTYDGSALRLYVDGAEAANASRAGASFSNTTNVLIGETLNDDMTVDEPAVYNQPLSAEQVKNHFELGSGRSFWVEGSNELKADASDDGSISRIAFYADDNLVSEDTTAPFTASWNTLDAAQPAYDGTHELRARAYDDHGQATDSAVVPTKVGNGRGTKFDAKLTSTTTSTVWPQTVFYDPAATTQEKQGIEVPVTNTSGSTWSASDVVVRYRWIGPDGTFVNNVGPDTSLGTDLAPNIERKVTVMVEPPTLPQGVDKAQYRLQVGLYSKTSSAWFSDKGSKPLENPVQVEKKLRTALGLERYNHYEAEEVGAGMQHLTNVANGNSLLRYTPFESPGRGLATVVDLTYNSLEKKSESPIGNNFSLSISGLTRFGSPLDIHPNKADSIAGRANKWVEFTDGDGTTHRFEGKESASGTYYEEPAGVHLFLRKYSDTDPQRAWAVTRPDRTTFFFDAEGYPTIVEDKNQNRLLFTLETTPPGEDPGGPKKRITAVTDATGADPVASPTRTFKVDYFTKAEASKPQVRGKIQAIRDHNGSALTFGYYDDGNLRVLSQTGGRKADGTRLTTRGFYFTYTTSDGSGPAIPASADRMSPDPKTPNQSTVLYSVRDPRGKQNQKETLFSYLGPGNGQDRWKLASREDRTGAKTTYAYNTASRLTTVTKALSRVSKYAYDALGSVTQITNPKNEVTNVAWSGDRNVSQVAEAGGGRTDYTYNDNGQLTEERKLLRKATDPGGEQVATTKLEYENLAVDAGDAGGRWKAGRTIPHLSQLAKKTDPRGTATAAAGDFEWAFAYDAKGNPTSDTDPDGGVSRRSYHPDGTLNDSADANGNSTFYGNYDGNGIANEVTRRISPTENQITRTEHDDDGLLRWIQDPNHAGDTGADGREYRTYFDYDAFQRLGRQSTPKSTKYDRGNLIWSGADYDENDNILQQVAPHYGKQDTGTGATTKMEYDPMDRTQRVYGPDTSVDPQGERTKMEYDLAGRMIQQTDPRGMASALADDFSTFYDYDELDRVVRESKSDLDSSGTATAVRRTHYCYDTVGDLRSQTAPKAGIGSVACAPDGAPAGTAYTTRTDYDAAHRQTAQVDPLGRRTSSAYDANGNVTGETDAQGAPTTIEFNGRGLPTKVSQAFEPGRTISTVTDYDAVGNKKRVVSPRGVDASGGTPGASAPYATAYQYDGLNRPTRIDVPTGGADTTPNYVHRSYDANGNLTATTLPVTQADAAQAPAEAKTELDYFDPASGETGGPDGGGEEDSMAAGGAEAGEADGDGDGGSSDGGGAGGWIRTSKDAVGTRAHFDYTAEGWQAERTPERLGGGGLELDKRMTSSYFADGQLKGENSQAGQSTTTYRYDANNNLIASTAGNGVNSPTQKPIEMETAYDGFDQATKTKQRKVGASNWQVTATRFDPNGNEAERTDNAEEDSSGASVVAGERNTFEYDEGDQVTEQLSYGKSTGAADDQRVTTAYTTTGLESATAIYRRDSAGAFQPRQSTTSDYYASGDPKSLTTKNGAGAVIESHALSYRDESGAYANGNRTSDRLGLDGPRLDSRCRVAAPCATTYSYDAKDRVTGERSDRAGELYESTYALDPAGNVTSERRPDGSVATSEYRGNQLTKRTIGADSENYFYDSEGNLDCSTSAQGSQADCTPAEGTLPSANVREDFSYDSSSRLAGYRRYKPGSTAQSKSDDAEYTYDAFDRPVEETESHGTDPAQTTSMDYLGLSDQLSGESRRDGSSTGPVRGKKAYSYGADGERLGMTDSPTGGSEKSYTYGRNPHGSVSLLLNDAGGAQASYGYRAYGDPDGQLTRENDPADPTGATPTMASNPLNPYRYSAKRFDTGSGTIDMGARRFSPTIGRFVQRDVYGDALGDLNLATDPLTQNRYQLAGANPVTFIELDGHRAGVPRCGRKFFVPGFAANLVFRRSRAGRYPDGQAYIKYHVHYQAKSIFRRDALSTSVRVKGRKPHGGKLNDFNSTEGKRNRASFRRDYAHTTVTTAPGNVLRASGHIKFRPVRLNPRDTLTGDGIRGAYCRAGFGR